VGYGLCAAGAVLTHYLSVVVLLAQGSFALVVFARRRRWGAFAGYLACALIVGLLFVPWYWYVRHVRGALYSETLSWIGRPSLDDCFSFLGREFFWGQVWTVHDRWWGLTLALPVAVLTVCAWLAWRSRSAGTGATSAAPARRIAYAAWLLAGPVVYVVLLSLLYHPVYHRSRFSLFVLPPFLVLAGIACDALRGRVLPWLLAGLLAGVMLAGTVLQYRTVQKTDWRSFAAVWREQGPPSATVFFPWFLDRAAGYAIGEPLLSTDREKMEPLLPVLRGAEVWICSLAGYDYKGRAGDAAYYRWLTGLGTVRPVALPTNLELQIVTVGGSAVPAAFRERFDRWYAPLDLRGKIEGFDDRARFHALEFDADGTPFRWSLPEAWLQVADADRAATAVLRVALPNPVGEEYRTDLSFFLSRTDDAEMLFNTAPVYRVSDFRPGPFEIELAVPPGFNGLLVGWTLNGVNLARAGISNDDRDLGLQVRWIGLVNGRD
jgi:hypothetical protein